MNYKCNCKPCTALCGRKGEYHTVHSPFPCLFIYNLVCICHKSTSPTPYFLGSYSFYHIFSLYKSKNQHFSFEAKKYNYFYPVFFCTMASSSILSLFPMCRYNSITICIYCNNNIIHIYIPVFSSSCNNGMHRTDFIFAPFDNIVYIQR